MIEFLRIANERFENLLDFSYKPHYLEGLKGYDDLRLHYIDEGPQDSNEAFLCLYG